MLCDMSSASGQVCIELILQSCVAAANKLGGKVLQKPNIGSSEHVVNCISLEHDPRASHYNKQIHIQQKDTRGYDMLSCILLEHDLDS